MLPLRNKKIEGDAKEFIQNLYLELKDNYDDKKTIIKYGDSAIKEADKIGGKYPSIISDITYLSDTYGVLEQLEERNRLSRK